MLIICRWLEGESAVPDLRNCKRCNKVFLYSAGLPICPACMDEDERMFKEVSAYLREYPGTPLSVVSDELNISYEKIMKYVREGRLQVLSSNGDYVRFCEKCGATISKGKFCADCEGHITNVLDISKKKLQGKLDEDSKLKSAYRFINSESKKK